jgi:hypothetical protein
LKLFLDEYLPIRHIADFLAAGFADDRAPGVEGSRVSKATDLMTLRNYVT